MSGYPVGLEVLPQTSVWDVALVFAWANFLYGCGRLRRWLIGGRR